MEFLGILNLLAISLMDLTAGSIVFILFYRLLVGQWVWYKEKKDFNIQISSEGITIFAKGSNPIQALNNLLDKAFPKPVEKVLEEKKEALKRQIIENYINSPELKEKLTEEAKKEIEELIKKDNGQKDNGQKDNGQMYN